VDQKLVTAGQADIRNGSRDLAALADEHQTLIADRHGHRPGDGRRDTCVVRRVEHDEVRQPPPSHEMIALAAFTIKTWRTILGTPQAGTRARL